MRNLTFTILLLATTAFADQDPKCTFGEFKDVSEPISIGTQLKVGIKVEFDNDGTAQLPYARPSCRGVDVYRRCGGEFEATDTLNFSLEKNLIGRPFILQPGTILTYIGTRLEEHWLGSTVYHVFATEQRHKIESADVADLEAGFRFPDVTQEDALYRMHLRGVFTNICRANPQSL